MLTIAVDAMGGDHAPKPEVEGAIRAAKTLGVRVILVGREDVLKRELESQGDHASLPIEIHHASEQITMHDSAARAVRSKRDSSLRVASRLVRDNCAQGFVSAGNTGAVMATAKMVQGVVPGADRPALAGVFPTVTGSPVVMVDVGANVDCSPSMLAQFATMGEMYSRVILHRENPRLIILSISGFGHDGPERGRAGYDQIVQGEAGLMSVTGTDDGRLTRVGVPIADLLAGIYGAFGVLAAVHDRARSGRGRVVRTSLLAALIGVHAFQGTRFTVAGEVPGPTGVHHPSICPYGLFEAEDGPIQIAVGTDAMWSRFAAEFGLVRPEWASNRQRVADRAKVDAAVQAVLRPVASDYLLSRLDQLGIPAGRVRNLEQVYEWEQTRSQHLIVEVNHPTLGAIRLPGPSVRFDDDEPGPHSPPPLLDEDGPVIRTWLGL